MSFELGKKYMFNAKKARKNQIPSLYGGDTKVPFYNWKDGKLQKTGLLTPEAVHVMWVEEDLFDFSSGYIQRGKHIMPKSATVLPWRLNQDYRFDRKAQSRWLQGVTLRGGINNVFDEDPALADEQYGYQPGTFNVRGRQFTMEVSKRF